MDALAATLPEPSGIVPEDMEARARTVAERHQRGKQARRKRDLTAEKYAVIVDGEGDSQWADVFNGSAVVVPPKLGGGLRLSRNLLRPMQANMIAYHTAIPFRALAIPAGDKAARDRAKIDTIFANTLIHKQNVNSLFAEALEVASVYGHCPVHAAWRDDISADPYQPVHYQGEDAEALGGAVRPGFVDAWVGDPWSTVYNEGASRRSIHRASYERILPLEVVKRAFAHVPGIELLKGRTDLPSASRRQRIVKKWTNQGGGMHGTAAIDGHHKGGEELVALICEETAPGIDPEFPMGRLEIVAIDGAATADKESRGAMGGQPFHLHLGPLPGGRFSFVRVYSWMSFDDVLGKPYFADLCDLQQQFNQLVTLRFEYIRRFVRPQLVAQAGSIEDDTMITEDDAVIEVTGDYPQFLTPPQLTQSFDAALMETLDQMFRIGGWQAASRGEANAADAAAKVVALARADDTIYGPINRDFQHTICEFLSLCRSLAKEYMTVPMLLELTGEDEGYLAEPWITGEDLSDAQYVLTQGYASPEAKLQQHLSLVTTMGADGVPLMSTADFHRHNPDPSLRPIEGEGERARRGRPHAINYAIRAACSGINMEEITLSLPPEWQPQAMEIAAAQVHEGLMGEFPLLRTDLLDLHIDVLDEIVQDEAEDMLVRRVAAMRQEMYFMQQQQIAMQQMMQQMGVPMPPEAGGGMPQMMPGAPQPMMQEGGTPTSNAMADLGGEVAALTAAAPTG